MGSRNLVLVVISLCSCLSLADTRVDGDVKLNGKVLFSFTPDHYILQTENYIYKIIKSHLSERAQNQLDRASLGKKNTIFSVPKSSIEYLWSSPLIESKTYQSRVSQIKDEAQLNEGKISLRGTIKLSFNEGFYLIQVNESVYQIKKETLTSQQADLINQTSIGDRINITLPVQAINLAWSFKQASASRSIASVEKVNSDFMKITDGKLLSLSGTMLLSQNEPLIFVQSSQYIYELEKNKISTESPRELDNPGAKIKLTVPLDGVKFVWSARPDQIEYKQRIPARAP